MNLPVRRLSRPSARSSTSSRNATACTITIVEATRTASRFTTGRGPCRSHAPRSRKTRWPRPVVSRSTVGRHCCTSHGVKTLSPGYRRAFPTAIIGAFETSPSSATLPRPECDVRIHSASPASSGRPSGGRARFRVWLIDESAVSLSMQENDTDGTSSGRPTAARRPQRRHTGVRRDASRSAHPDDIRLSGPW